MKFYQIVFKRHWNPILKSLYSAYLNDPIVAVLNQCLFHFNNKSKVIVLYQIQSAITANE
jgi:hypothetical protein